MKYCLANDNGTEWYSGPFATLKEARRSREEDNGGNDLSVHLVQELTPTFYAPCVLDILKGMVRSAEADSFFSYDYVFAVEGSDRDAAHAELKAWCLKWVKAFTNAVIGASLLSELREHREKNKALKTAAIKWVDAQAGAWQAGSTVLSILEAPWIELAKHHRVTLTLQP